MAVIGITGPIGSGKSMAAEFLHSQGAHLIDVDRMAHQYLQPEMATYSEIVESFGSGILEASGQINRARLGAVVFENPQRLKHLNEIIHPALLDELLIIISQFKQTHPTRLLVVDAALLFQWNLQEYFHWVLWIDSALEVRRQRMLAAGRLSAEEFERRDMAQKAMFDPSPMAENILRISNIYTKAHLKKELIRFLTEVVNYENKEHNT